MNIQFAQDLFHFGIKIPGIQFIHFHNGVTQLITCLPVRCKLQIP